MKKKLLITLIAICPLMAFTFFNAYNSNNTSKASEKEAIEELILESYIHGAFNELNADAMLNGFHPDFAIFYADGENLGRYEIETWAEGVRKRKNDPEFDASKNAWKHNFATIDITENVATVKVELSKDGNHIYTDYLSLIKFDSGWKIVGKVYHQHK